MGRRTKSIGEKGGREKERDVTKEANERKREGGGEDTLV